METIRFLNFRHDSLAGNSFHDDDPRFEMLSPGANTDHPPTKWP